MIDVILPGYTRVTDPLYLYRGFSGIPEDVLNNAANRGKAVHELADMHMNGDLVFESDFIRQAQSYSHDQNGNFDYQKYTKELEKIRYYFNSFLIWSEGKQFLPTQPRWYCDTYKITGLIDRLVLNQDGKLVLVDFKTPVSESKTWMLQGSAYHYLATLHGHKIDLIEFVQLSREGKKPKIKHYEPDFEFYTQILRTYRYFEGEPAPDISDYL